MPVSLVESAKISQDKLAKGVMETFVQESVVLDRIPLMPVEGNAFSYSEEATLPGVAWRAVNTAYNESTGTVNNKTEMLRILGGDADVDKFIVQTRGNLNDQRAVQTKLKVKALNYAFQDSFINGDSGVDPLSIDGLKTRLTGAQVITAATNGLVISVAQHDFLDKLDALCAAVNGGPDVLYMNASVKAALQSLARRLGGWHTYQDIATGKPISSYNGIPIADIGNKPDGSAILPFTETCGSSNVTSSIYAVKFGEDESEGAVTGLINGGVMVTDLGEMETKASYRTRIEAYIGLAVFSGKAAARLTGIKVS